jgi:hypothetical protein
MPKPSRPLRASASKYAVSIAPVLTRPLPPEQLREHALVDERQDFEPDRDAWEWIRATFLEQTSPLHNPEHAHLRFAHVGILWTNVGNSRQMRRILGQAEMPMARGGKWAKARHDLQLREWFGSVPDFVITLDAPFCAEADDASFCALVEHELMHCAQRRNPYGAPLFSRSTGKPIFGIRGHDVEEFVGIVRRYGAIDGGVLALAAAAREKPLIDLAKIATVCGTVAPARAA